MSNDRQPAESYDVAILGGGPARVTLAPPPTTARPDTSIFIAEKREGPAREAAFKVGESTQEISCEYFANVLGFKEHLEKEQITKSSRRFWSPAGDNSELAERVERGPARRLPVHTYQLDRGRFENFLGEQALAAGIDLVGSARARAIELGDEQHEITYTLGSKESTDERKVKARWIVDASGRAVTLEKKLGLIGEKGNVSTAPRSPLAG